MMTEKVHRADEAHDLQTLVGFGDGACAHGDAAGLAEIAHLLSLSMAPPAQIELDEIARIAPTDLGAAGERWWSLTRRIRELLDFPGNPVHRD